MNDGNPIRRAWRIMAATALLLAAASILLSVLLFAELRATDDDIRRTANDVAREGRDRRDQACRGLELGHQQEIADLKQSYRFYRDPPPEFRGLLNNPQVLEQVRERERAARVDQDRFGVFVPAYCDEPGEAAEKRGAAPVGLPEPDPVLPARPERLDELLEP